MESQGYITQKMLKWAIVVLALIVIILCFFACPGRKDTSVPVITPPKEIVKAINDTIAVYNKKVDSANAVNADLKNENASTLDQLHAAQARANQLAAKLRARPKGDTTIIEGGEQAGNGTIDEYIANSEHKDTLCNKAIENLQGQVANREYVISQKDTLFSKLRSSFDFTISQQEVLIKYNKDLKKQISKKKFANTFWKVTTGLGALGIVAALLK